MHVSKSNHIVLGGIAALWMVLCVAGETQAAAYIKFEGVDGECADKDHKGWSDLVSFSQELGVPISATGATRRRAGEALSSFVLGKELDKSSPKLAEALLKGEVIPSVTIHLTTSSTDAGRATYYAYELKNVRITSYVVTGSGQGETVPKEELKISFEQIKVTYTERDHAGKAKNKIEYTWKF